MPIPCAAKEIRSRKSLTAKEIPARALSGHNYLNGLIYLVLIILMTHRTAKPSALAWLPALVEHRHHTPPASRRPPDWMGTLSRVVSQLSEKVERTHRAPSWIASCCSSACSSSLFASSSATITSHSAPGDTTQLVTDSRRRPQHSTAITTNITLEVLLQSCSHRTRARRSQPPLPGTSLSSATAPT